MNRSKDFEQLRSGKDTYMMHAFSVTYKVLVKKQNVVKFLRMVLMEENVFYGILKGRNFVISDYLYRTPMQKIINVIEKIGFKCHVLFEMKVHKN